MADFERTDRSTVKRLAKRGTYDRDTIFAILDEGLVCHVGFVVDGAPRVIPTIYARIDETLYIHGSVASRMLRTLQNGVETCATITLIDGLVLARSAFHHSMNYRSVMIHGIAHPVEGEEKERALTAFVEHVVQGRSAEVRGPNDAERKQTTVLALPIEEVSAKVRTGGPIDDEEDYALPYWAGVLPLTLTPQQPVDDERLAAGIATPPGLRTYRRG
jgi:nitroimidazol reductase NimA-like FMN-containing flavoprotein (pyridoxamine 5'-phosphate oxidase superfamily)